MLALPAAPAPPRPRQMMMATAIACAGGLLLIAGLLAVYMNLRWNTGNVTSGWLSDGAEIPQVATHTMLPTVGFTVVMAMWAWWAMGRNDRTNTVVALTLTLLFGAALVNAQFHVWREMGLGIADDIYNLAFYAVTITMTALFVVGMVFSAVALFHTLGGRYSARNNEALAAHALVWWFLMVAFGAVWYLLYVLK